MDYRQEFYKTNDGLTLAYRRYGSDFSQNIPVICLPGLTRNAKDFHDFALHVAQNRNVIVLDARGRGQSEYDSNWQNYNVVTEVGDIIALLLHCQIDRAIFVGTSRGGIQSMIYSAVQPGVMAGLIMNDIGPEVEVEGLDRIIAGMGGVETHADWPTVIEELKAGNQTQYPFFSKDDWLDFAHRCYRETDQGILPDYDPNLIKQVAQELEVSKGATLWSQFSTLSDVPLLSIRGGLSDLLSQDTVSRMIRERPDMTTLTVRNVGHVPLLNEPEVIDAVDMFFLNIDQSGKK